MSDSDEKIEYVDGIGYRYNTEWIASLEPETHWRLYWRQQKIMEKFVRPGHRALEIGVGTGFTANYLRSKGIEVVTLDIDADKKPDIIANIVKYEFNDVYDHILAFEVFEHIPFDQFEIVIKKLSQACRQYLFLSVPRNEIIFVRGSIKLPRIPELDFTVRGPTRKHLSKNHFWEIDDPATSRVKFEQTLTAAGFSVLHHEQAFSRLYYVLQSSSLPDHA